MKTIFCMMTTLALAFYTYQPCIAQCAADSNLYRFTYQTHAYDVVREFKTFDDAAACAVLKGGYLVHLDNPGEQTAVFAGIQSAGVSSNYKSVADGGGASYVWMGANDKTIEGTWLWDGKNDGTGNHFWTGQGSAGSGGGNPVNSAFVNWGGAPNYQEPDNYNNNQHCAGIALSAWPLGSTAEWNDLSCTNTLYYIIEYNTITGIHESDAIQTVFQIQPNPANHQVIFETSKSGIATLTTLSGKTVKSFDLASGSNQIDLADLESGIYFVQLNQINEVPQIQKLFVQ